MIYKIIFTIIQGLAFCGYVLQIGKERKPVTPHDVVGVFVIDMILMVCFWLFV